MKTGSLVVTLLILASPVLAVDLVASCSCSETGLEGEPDADDPETDTGIDPVPMCWDVDGDGHEDESCG